MAVLTARSFLARFILAIPHAPPSTAKGSNTTVADATAAPAHGPALAAAAPPATATALPVAAPAAPDPILPFRSSFPAINSWLHSAIEASSAALDAGGEASVGANSRGLDEQPDNSNAIIAAQPENLFRMIDPPARGLSNRRVKSNM
jgi:hypothetical protein